MIKPKQVFVLDGVTFRVWDLTACKWRDICYASHPDGRDERFYVSYYTDGKPEVTVVAECQAYLYNPTFRYHAIRDAAPWGLGVGVLEGRGLCHATT